MDKVPMTPDGLKRMKIELDYLLKIVRPAISAAIEEARGHGDLKENAEYHAAKEKQGMSEARVNFLQDRIARSEVIDPTKLSGERILMGATVKLVDVDTDKEVTYSLVGPEEADLENGLISVASPLGHALIGKEVDDEVIFRAPGGTHTYDILEVVYKHIPIAEFVASEGIIV